MEHNYQIVVPTTTYDRPAPADIVDSIRRMVKTSMAEAFGGYTETRAVGGYVAESGALIEEAVYVIEASYEVANDELVFQLAERIKRVMKQESVMVRKDHEVHFV